MIAAIAMITFIPKYVCYISLSKMRKFGRENNPQIIAPQILDKYLLQNRRLSNLCRRRRRDANGKSCPSLDIALMQVLQKSIENHKKNLPDSCLQYIYI